MDVDPQIREICQRVPIVDYLEARGVRVMKAGRGFKCKCPLPDHANDKTPSFSIRTLDDGQVFHCFGCNKSGNIITLQHLLERQKKGDIVRKLAMQCGVKLSRLARGAKIEPLHNDVLTKFCEEQVILMDIASWGYELLRAYKGSEDTVNKVSRVYQKAERLANRGDNEGLIRLRAFLLMTMNSYEGK